MATTSYSTKTQLDSHTPVDLSIPLNLSNSSAKDDISLKNLYDDSIKRFGEPRTFQLHQHPDGTCSLQNWHGRSQNKQDPLPSLSPPQHNTRLPFVIQIDASQNKILRIGENKHYYAANKASSVLAAGDIYFSQDNKIHFFNDKSGAYCLPEDGFYIERKIATFMALMKVGLPMDKFRFFRPSQQATMALYLAYTRSGKDIKEALCLVLMACNIDKDNAQKLISSGSVTYKNFSEIAALAKTTTVVTRSSEPSVTTLKTTQDKLKSSSTSTLVESSKACKAFTDTIMISGQQKPSNNPGTTISSVSSATSLVFQYPGAIQAIPKLTATTIVTAETSLIKTRAETGQQHPSNLANPGLVEAEPSSSSESHSPLTSAAAISSPTPLSVIFRYPPRPISAWQAQRATSNSKLNLNSGYSATGTPTQAVNGSSQTTHQSRVNLEQPATIRLDTSAPLSSASAQTISSAPPQKSKADIEIGNGYLKTNNQSPEPTSPILITSSIPEHTAGSDLTSISATTTTPQATDEHRQPPIAEKTVHSNSGGCCLIM